MYYSSQDVIAKQYDIYYEGGKKSLYNIRFGIESKVTLREKQLLKKHLEVAIQSSIDKNVTILDFGCGDGRTMSILYAMAFHHLNYNFTIKAYDVSQVGLSELVKSLLDEGFQCINPTISELNGQKYQKNNVVIEIVIGDPSLSAPQLETLFGSGVNLVLCLFGVLSHIPGAQNRLAILQMFKNILIKKGVVFISLPTYAAHNKTANHFEQLRSSSDCAESNIHLAKENGDIYYKIQGADLYNFYHLYSMQEVLTQLRETGVIISDTGIYSMLLPSQICKSTIVNVADYVLTHVLSLPIMRRFFSKTIAKYLFVTAIK
jgi:hypothetical protein